MASWVSFPEGALSLAPRLAPGLCLPAPHLRPPAPGLRPPPHLHLPAPTCAVAVNVECAGLAQFPLCLFLASIPQ